jgi:hypothetical protein
MPFGLPDEVGVPVGRSRRGSARGCDGNRLPPDTAEGPQISRQSHVRSSQAGLSRGVRNPLEKGVQMSKFRIIGLTGTIPGQKSASRKYIESDLTTAMPAKISPERSAE